MHTSLMEDTSLKWFYMLQVSSFILASGEWELGRTGKAVTW